nr:MAG TPA: hypothetical protein [Caudoviricetes sp.]
MMCIIFLNISSVVLYIFMRIITTWKVYRF